MSVTKKPERTPSGDFVFYHGTSPEGAQSIMQSHTLRPDGIGAVGISTTWGQAQVFASMKRGPILKLVIPAAFFSSGQAIVKREIGGSGRNQFLITGADHMPITVPLLDVQVFDPDAHL